MRATTLLGLSFLQSPWLTLSQSTPQYGYNGPGVYRIVSLSSSLPIGYNTSTDTKVKPIVSVAKNDKDTSQRWLIAEVTKTNGATTVVIINDSTGDIMSSSPYDNYFLAADKPALLSRPEGRWVIDTNNPFYPGPASGKPIRFNNIGNAGSCLDLEMGWGYLGTRILTYPYNNPISTNQVWLLECLEDGCRSS